MHTLSVNPLANSGFPLFLLAHGSERGVNGSDERNAGDHQVICGVNVVVWAEI